MESRISPPTQIECPAEKRTTVRGNHLGRGRSRLNLQHPTSSHAQITASLREFTDAHPLEFTLGVAQRWLNPIGSS